MSLRPFLFCSVPKTMKLFKKVLSVIFIKNHYQVIESVHWRSGLGNYFVYKSFAVQTLLWLLEFAIQINLQHDTITVYIHFILLTTLLFKKLSFYKERVLNLFTKHLLKRWYLNICQHLDNPGFFRGHGPASPRGLMN